MKSTVPDFTGKVLSIVLKGAEWTRAIQDPHFELQCGRLFLVGTSPREASTRDWIAGSRYAVAWDSVLDYAVFDSVDEYLDRLRRFDRKKKASGK